MTELTNPLFENEKEFLERQRQEYKNALMGDVETIKEKSEKVGTTLLVAGGLLAGAWLITRMFSSGDSDKPKKKKKKKKVKMNVLEEQTFQSKMHKPHKVKEYDSMVHEQEDEFTLDSEHANEKQESGLAKVTHSIMQSEMMSLLLHQLSAFLMVYITKKIEEYVNVHKNTDIAGTAEPETRDIDFAYYDETAR